MRVFHSLLVVAALMLCGMKAVAQTDGNSQTEVDVEADELGYKPFPYGFIQVQGGLGTTLTDVTFTKLLSPTFSIAAGKMFTPIVGARLHVNGYQSKGGLDAIVPVEGEADAVACSLKKYDFNYINTNADVMVNLINIFSKKVRHPFDLYLIGGIGLNYAWDNGDFECITSQYNVCNDISNAWGDNQTPRSSLLSHNLRLGLLADINIAKHWSLGAEVDFNSLDDRFNSKYKNADDWMVTAQLSITYKFGFKKYHAPAPVPVVEKPVYQEPEKVEVVPEPEPQPVVKEEPIKEVLFYVIRESDVTDNTIISKVAEWCKKYPNKTITIDGYADEGTGTAKLNMEYSQQRAEKVATALQAQGVPTSQMNVKWHGDTIQPFTDNVKNRCVIIEGK